MERESLGIGYGPWVTFASYAIVAALFLWGSVARWSLIGPFLISGGLIVLGMLELISAKVKVSRTRSGNSATTWQKTVLVGTAIAGISSMLIGIYMTWMR